jgi:hypothetical protein
LLLAEKGGGELGPEKSCAVTAVNNFQFIGTMNPGGDYGKKEVCVLELTVVHSLVDIGATCPVCAEQGTVPHMNSSRIIVTGCPALEVLFCVMHTTIWRHIWRVLFPGVELRVVH